MTRTFRLSTAFTAQYLICLVYRRSGTPEFLGTVISDVQEKISALEVLNILDLKNS